MNLWDIFTAKVKYLINANIKKPIVTIPNLKASAAKGDAFWTIISPEMNADDHSNINSKGNVLIIYWGF